MAYGMRATAHGELLFARRHGGPWSDDDYRNWRGRVFRPAALEAGLQRPRPYDLRHSFVSLLIQEGVSIVEVARQAGHSPEECLRTYAHTFEEFDAAERLSAEEAIIAARQGRSEGAVGRVADAGSEL